MCPAKILAKRRMVKTSVLMKRPKTSNTKIMHCNAKCISGTNKEVKNPLGPFRIIATTVINPKVTVASAKVTLIFAVAEAKAGMMPNKFKSRIKKRGL